MKPLNIFDILSASDKELVHSSMLKYFIDFEMLKNDFFSFLSFTEPKEKLIINLEKAENLIIPNEPKKKLRFDLYLTTSNEDKPKLIIENKFKAIPYLNQLINYDKYFESKKITAIHKVLFVLSEEQIPINIKNYCNQNNWKIRAYISLDPLKKDPTINLLDWLGTINLDKNIDARTKLLIDDYHEYLKSLSNEIIQLTENEYFVPYSNQKYRHIYAQYLMFIQSLIYKKLHESGLTNILPTNDGGKNIIPSVAFWLNENLSSRKMIKDAYASIDGSTFKLGIHYDRKNHQSAEEIVDEINQTFHQHKKYFVSLELKENNRKIKPVDINRPKKTESVFSIFTFSIRENQPINRVIEDIANISKEYFHYFR